MRQKIASALRFAATVLVAGALVALGAQIINRTFFAGEASLTAEFAGSFWGAFFAFVFVLVSAGLGKWYDRRARNYSSMVRMQHVLNDVVSRLYDNLHELDIISAVFRGEKKKEAKATILANRFMTIEFDAAPMIDFINLDFLNECFQLYVDSRLANNHMVILNRSHDDRQHAVLTGAITPEEYSANLKSSTDELEKLKGRLDTLLDDTTRVFAICRLLCKKKPLLVRASRRFHATRYPPDFAPLVGSEVAKLEAEVRDNPDKKSKWAEEVKQAAEHSAA